MTAKSIEDELMNQLAKEIQSKTGSSVLANLGKSVAEQAVDFVEDKTGLDIPVLGSSKSESKESLPVSTTSYFKDSEFVNPKDTESVGKTVKPELIAMLNKAREIAGNPWKVNSGLRSPAYNKQVGGVAGSAHVRGLAADISATTGAKKFEVVKSAIEAGFTRIGIAKTFIHLDIDSTKPQNTIFLY